MVDFPVQINASDVETILRAATASSRNDNPVEAAVLLMAAAEVVLRSFSTEKPRVEAQLKPHAKMLADKIEADLGEYDPTNWGALN